MQIEHLVFLPAAPHKKTIPMLLMFWGYAKGIYLPDVPDKLAKGRES